MNRSNERKTFEDFIESTTMNGSNYCVNTLE